MRTKYRIVRDAFAGFEVQSWRWWWPFWVQCEFCNTHSSLEAAQQWLERHRQAVVWTEA